MFGDILVFALIATIMFYIEDHENWDKVKYQCDDLNGNTAMDQGLCSKTDIPDRFYQFIALCVLAAIGFLLSLT